MKNNKNVATSDLSESAGSACIGIYDDFDAAEISQQPRSVRLAWSYGRILRCENTQTTQLDAPICSPVLCYVDGQWAYFTTKKLSEQWGDDWNDAPYEDNAGEPYTYGDHDRKEGCEPWEIVKVAWCGDFETPCTDQCNSRWSVDRINAGGVAWMQTSRWSSGEAVIIPAGTTLSDFCRLIAAGGGEVYLKNTEDSRAKGVG